MHISYSEIVVQIIGFLIALAILRRYAWKPILRLIDERREKVEGLLGGAEEKSKRAEELKAELEEKLRSIESVARARIQEAAKEGQTAATEIRNQAREEAKGIIQRAREETEREVERGRAQLGEDIVNIAMSAAEKLIGESLDEPRQRKLVEEFIEHVDRAQE